MTLKEILKPHEKTNFILEKLHAGSVSVVPKGSKVKGTVSLIEYNNGDYIVCVLERYSFIRTSPVVECNVTDEQNLTIEFKTKSDSLYRLTKV